MKNITNTKLIVIDEKPESAEAIAHALRDAGKMLPVNWVNSALRLQKAIEADLDCNQIVLANANLPWLPMDQVCQICSEHNIITIALGDIPNSTLELRVLRQGAFALVNPSHPGLLEQRLNQAIQQSLNMLSLRQQERKLEDMSLRCDALLDTAAEPIAYTSEGVITSANPLFAEAVGADDEVQLVGRLISDFIGPESLYQFSRNLRTLMRGDNNQLHMEDTAISCLGGNSSPAAVFMSNVTVDGEHSTQILLRNHNVQHAVTASRKAALKPEASQLLNLMDVPLGQHLKQKIQSTQKVASGLKLVHDQKSIDTHYQVELKKTLEDSSLNSMMARLSAWGNEVASPNEELAISANDAFRMPPLPELLAKGEASLCTQPLLSMHGDEPLLLARIKSGDALMPISQMLEDNGDSTSVQWLLEQLKTVAKDSQLVLGPITKEGIRAASIEVLQELNLNNQLILGVSEQTLSSDYHGSSQFLLQLQKLDMKVALWMNSPAAVLSGLLADLADSVRSGIHTLVLSDQDFPVITQEGFQSEEWAQLIGLCQRNNIQLIAPRPFNEEQLQTWWQIGAGWCLAGENAASSKMQQTGTDVE